MTREWRPWAAALIARLAAAEDDVGPAELPTPGTLTVAARCECCGACMPAGSEVASWWDDDAGEVLAHWEACPAAELWAAQCADDEGRWYPIYRTDTLPAEVPFVGTYEEAWIEAQEAVTTVGDMLGGVRIVRVTHKEVQCG